VRQHGQDEFRLEITAGKVWKINSEFSFLNLASVNPQSDDQPKILFKTRIVDGMQG
jgi:hypothetical protein